MKNSIIITIYWIVGIMFAYLIYIQHDNTSTQSAIALLGIWIGVFFIGVVIHLIRKHNNSQ